MMEVDPELRRAFETAGRPLELRAGEVLVREGEAGGDLHLLEAGILLVHAFEDRRPIVATLAPPELIGDLSVLTGGARTATVIARTDVRLRHLSADQVDEHLQQSPALALALGRAAATRLTRSAPGEGLQIDGWVDPSGHLEATRAALAASGGWRWLSPADVDDALGPGHAEAARGPRAMSTAAWVAERALEGPVVLVASGSAPRAWEERVRRHADGLVECADDAESREQGRHLLVSSRARAGGGPAGAQIVVVGAAGLEDDLRAFLSGELPATVQAFQDLPRSARRALEAAAERVTLVSGEVFCEQGDPSDTIAWVLEGRFDVLREGKTLGRIGPGEVLGEVSYLTGASRGAAVVAARDSVLAVIPFRTLDHMGRLHPSIARVLGAHAAQRLSEPSARTTSRSLALVPLPGAEFAARELAGALSQVVGARVLDLPTVSRELGVSVTAVEEGAAMEPWIRAWFARAERMAERTVTVVGTRVSDWTSRCLRQADEVVVVGRGDRMLEHPALADVRVDALALWWPDGRIHGTGRWLSRYVGADWMHLTGERQSLERAARRLAGVGSGLALAGASSRGIAHLGVVRGLKDRGWPIDRLAGSSSGGQIAALVAMLCDEREAVRRSLRILQGFDSRLRRWNPPFLSLLSGAQVERLVREAFGDLRIEDLPLSVQLTGTDLNRGELVVLDRGPLWEAVRVTTSLPVIWPPVSRGGRVMVDGGIVNNAPADLMPDCSRVVLSEVIPAGTERFPGVEPYGTHLSGWRLLARRLRGRRARVPSLLGVLMESMMMANIAQRRRLDGMPGLVPLTIGIPDMGFFGLRTPEQAASLIELAADITAKGLAAWEEEHA